MIRNIPWVLSFLFIALLACKRPDNRIVTEEKIPPPFLKTKFIAGDTKLEFVLSFPQCAYDTGFGLGPCSHVLCRASYNGRRVERMEQRVCATFEDVEVPLLAYANSEAERGEILNDAATTFARAHKQFADDRKLSTSQEVIIHTERLPSFANGPLL